MIRNIKKNQLLNIKEEIPVKPGCVVSQNLARQEGFEISLYSFGDGEGISSQVSFGDTFYYVIGGKAAFELGHQRIEGKSNFSLMVPWGKAHSIMAKEALQILYIQIFKEGEQDMFIENFVQNQVVDLAEQIQWEKGKIISTTLVQRNTMTLTLFAFDEGEGVSTHASEGDAMVVVLDGSADITVDGVTKRAQKGQTIIMPANIPHAVKAVTPYKMLLIVVKPEIN